MEQPETRKIKEICQEFFEKMGFAEDLEIGRIESDSIPVKLKVEEPRVLIGQNGQTLIEIQRLLQNIVRRKSGSEVHLDLDINEYKKKKMEYLRELARTTADQVLLTKKEKELPAMPAYERRIIHMELSERQGVKTESIGEEPERRIIIRPE